MNLTHFTAFIAALQSIFKSGAGSMGLSERELFMLANEQCLQEANLNHTEYRAYADVFDADNRRPTEPLAAAHYEVYQCISLAAAKHRNTMLNAIANDEPNWRRFCWLLAHADKHNAQDRKARMAYLKGQNAKQKLQKADETTVTEIVQEASNELTTEAETPITAQPEATPIIHETAEVIATPVVATPETDVAPAQQAPSNPAPPKTDANPFHQSPVHTTKTSVDSTPTTGNRRIKRKMGNLRFKRNGR